MKYAFNFTVVDDDDQDVAYLRFIDAKQDVTVHNTIRLHDLVPKYTGADVYLDFTEAGELIGIEFLL